MKYQDIPTFQQRMKTNKPTSEADIQLRLHEEIAELRHFIDWHLQQRKTDNWVEGINNTAA